MAGGGRKRQKRILAAGRVLEIYAAGGNYPDVVREFGQPRDPTTKSKLNADELLAWAYGAYLSDEAKKAGQARVAMELQAIAYARNGKKPAHATADRLRALKLLGDAYGLFVERVELGGTVGVRAEVRVYLPHNDRDQTEPGPAGKVPKQPR